MVLTLSSSCLRAGISRSASFFTATTLERVPQPTTATLSSGDSIHSRASSQPCGPSAATHATANSATMSLSVLPNQLRKSSLVIFDSSAIRPAKYIASYIPVSKRSRAS